MIGGIRKTRRARRAENYLVDMSIKEVSNVDRPANGRPFSVIKSAGETPVVQEGDALVRQETAEPDEIERVAARFGDALNGIAKALSVSESARGMFYDKLGEFYGRLNALYELVCNVDGSVLGGSLDAPVAEELGALGEMLAELADAFSTGVAKRGAKMSRRNSERMRKITGSLQESIADLAGLLDELTGIAKGETPDEPAQPAEESPTIEARLGAVEKSVDELHAASADAEEAIAVVAGVAKGVKDRVADLDARASATDEAVHALKTTTAALKTTARVVTKTINLPPVEHAAEPVEPTAAPAGDGSLTDSELIAARSRRALNGQR